MSLDFSRAFGDLEKLTRYRPGDFGGTVIEQRPGQGYYLVKDVLDTLPEVDLSLLTRYRPNAVGSMNVEIIEGTGFYQVADVHDAVGRLSAGSGLNPDRRVMKFALQMFASAAREGAEQAERDERQWYKDAAGPAFRRDLETAERLLAALDTAQANPDKGGDRPRFETWARNHVGMPDAVPFVWSSDWAKAAHEGWCGALSQQVLAPVHAWDVANLRVACRDAADALRKADSPLLANRLISNVEAVLGNGAVGPTSKAGDRQVAGPVAAWMTEDGERVVTASTKEGITRDGGASASAMLPYTVALGRLTPEVPQPK